MPSVDSITHKLQAKAEELEFDACAVAPAQALEHGDYFLEWLREDKHGEMHWLAREPERRLDPSILLPGAHSIVVLGLNYYQPQPERRGAIATYALGQDYHTLFLEKTEALAAWLTQQGGAAKCYVDTGPLLEKPIARLSGIGWQGKSTMLIHPKMGTWLFLGFILTTLKLEANQPMHDHCGSCTRCIVACPTRAITAPYQLDARRCIAYLTIEHKGPIPLEWRRAIHDRLYGCDDCLTACPWNRWARLSRHTQFHARAYPDLQKMLAWNEADFRAAFAGTAILRLKLNRWLRNVSVVLGNIGSLDDIPSLQKAICRPEPLVAEHAAWAIEEIETRHRRPV